MVILISCAKTMTEKKRFEMPFTTIPLFLQQARENAIELAQCPTDELEKMLHVKTDLAIKNHLRFRDFFSEEPASIPAIAAYSGTVFKNIGVADFTTEDFYYTQEHLRITSFLYGLLRPLDGIKSYRLEGNVKLQCNENRSMFEAWREPLTKLFIDYINKNGGTLVYLASEEMKMLFDWRQVEKEVNIIYPEFQVMKKDKLKTIVMYAKMCRGQMTRYIIKNRLKDSNSLKEFSWEGFTYSEERSRDGKLSFIFHL